MNTTTMRTIQKTIISVQTTVDAPVAVAWKKWTTPDDIIKWNAASDDWHTLWAENDLKPGGNFNYRMEARDGSMGFDFGGVYGNVVTNRIIDYTLGDGRSVHVAFTAEGNQTHIMETFEAETTNLRDMQKAGWQSILNNFKRYVEMK